MDILKLLNELEDMIEGTKSLGIGGLAINFPPG